MASPLVQKLSGVRDLKRILETTVRELGETFRAEACQVMLSNPLDPNVTSICEYRAGPDVEDEPVRVTLPLVLQGRTFGSVSVSRENELSSDEVNTMRVLLGELGDIIRLAQINDIVQRDTFRETFLVEIGNVMAYSLGIGDALFMVVNILGRALLSSRCLFICTDDTQAGWKCYEFWQQDKVRSCQEYYWPSTDSSLVAQVLLARAPLCHYEGQENSYVSPVQEELQFIGVKSFLGVALRSGNGTTHGCVILQQCDYRRAWTRNEIDMVQNVADKVADALVKLPAEKLAREPIMQLHQRIVTPADSQEGQTDVQLRRALKTALGQQAIPSARKTTQPALPPKPDLQAAVAAAAAATPAPAPATAAPAAATPPPAPVQPVQAPVETPAPAASPTSSRTNLPPTVPQPSSPMATQEYPIPSSTQEYALPTQQEQAAPLVDENFSPETGGEHPKPTIKPVVRRGTGEFASMSAGTGTPTADLQS
ncbi:MAG: GAF domain-containing protein, partial [Cyanobacteria bacterium]|nr:GAF domain-containing protein [Cyanobacteriota bacterium]